MPPAQAAETLEWKNLGEAAAGIDVQEMPPV
jgi:hypothetical protein